MYVYNDKVFRPDDWDGIRMLGYSVKDKDPMKVGRFGLGFKSVFHMTGWPALLLIDDVRAFEFVAPIATKMLYLFECQSLL